MSAMMSAFTWRDREPFGPFVARSIRGVLHRAQVVRGHVVLHKRCAAGKPVRAAVLSNEEAVEYATGREAVLCRYPWCFREAVRAAGIDPGVGHAARTVSRRLTPRLPAKVRHLPEPVEQAETEPRWWWCSCDRIIFEVSRAHNPDDRWWVHKGTGYRGPAA